MNENNAETAPEAEATPPGPPATSKKAGRRTRRPYRARRYAAGFLIVLFSISLFASVVSFWGARQVLNTNVFVSHLTTAIQDPNVQKEITNYVSNEVVKVVNPAPKIANVLPPKAKVIVGPVVLAFENLVHSAVQKLVASPGSRRSSSPAIRHTHAAAVALLEGKTKGNLVIQGNEVVLNTLPLIDSTIRALEQQNVLSRLLVHVPPLAASNGTPSQQIEQLSHRLGVTLPPNFGQIVVFRSNTLRQAQSGLKKLRRTLILEIVLTLVLFVLAIVVAPFRLRTVAQLGGAAAIVGLLTWAGTKWATNHVVQLATNGNVRAALRAIVNAETGGLSALVLVVAAIGVVAAVLAFIFGESPQAGGTRAAVKRTTAKLPAAARSSRTFVNAHADGVRIVGYVVGLGIVLIWLNWTALFIAIGVVLAWQIAVSFIERAEKVAGSPPAGDGPAGALSSAAPAPEG